MEVGIPELVIILVIVILIFGPGRIAKLSRELGTGIRQFRQGLEEKSESNEQE
jgi:sec-independent protein translocase protein TatA